MGHKISMVDPQLLCFYFSLPIYIKFTIWKLENNSTIATIINSTLFPPTPVN